MGKFMDKWKWYIGKIKWNKWNSEKTDKWTTFDKWREIKKEKRFLNATNYLENNPFLLMFLFFQFNY